MADAENLTPNPTPVAPEPVSATPAVEAVPSSPPEAPVASPAESAPVVKQDESSLLGAEPPVEVKDEKPVIDKKPEAKADDKKTGEKPAEVKPVDGVKPEANKLEVTEIVSPTYEPFVVTEGIGAGLKPDEKVMNEFSGLLGKLETAKSDHKEFQNIGQQLVDLYVGRTNEALKAQTDYYVALHEKQKTNEFEALRQDPVIGKGGDGEAFNAYKRDMANFLAANGGTKEEVVNFRKFVDERGVANALPLVRILHNLKSKIERYESEGSKMLPGTKPAPSKPPVGKGIMNALYGGQKSA